MIVLSRLILLMLAAAVALQLAHSPFATNDGPVHVAFAHLISSHGSPDSPLQNFAYTVNLRPTPNLISYFILVPLMKVLSPQAAEATLQGLCILTPVLAGWFAIQTIDPDHEYLALALFPFSLNQMFFLGLYNYALSIAAFFVAIALYLRLDAKPTTGRAAALASALLLAFVCHAAGFMMAVAGIGTIAGTKAVLQLLRGQALRTVVSAQRLVLASLMLPLPAGLLFVSATGSAPIEFGSGVLARVDQFIHLTALDISSDTTRYMARGLRTALACGVSWAMASVVMEKGTVLPPERFERSLGMVAAGLSATIVMLAIPDTLGGGWTHFRRMVVFPYFWVIVLLASVRIPRIGAAAAIALGSAASLAGLISAVDVQRTIEQQMSPLAEVDKRIGAHCTVAPVVLESHPRDATGQPMTLRFEPYFEAASRLELKDDRVVLFNFLARLEVYPVRFRPEVEPQQHLFGWRPYQHDVRTRQINVDAYEAASGLPVDYLLVWGKPSEPNALLRRQIETEASRSRLVYRSDDGWVSLYRRPTAKGGLCSAQ